MLRLNAILGQGTDPVISERLHALGHAGRVEYITLSHEDMLRRRLRVFTDRGTECAIALQRSERLTNGAVLLLEHDRAIVVRMEEEAWLDLVPSDIGAALELGYSAGNMHWRVRFDGATLKIAREGPAQDYLDRLAPLLEHGKVRRNE